LYKKIFFGPQNNCLDWKKYFCTEKYFFVLEKIDAIDISSPLMDASFLHPQNDSRISEFPLNISTKHQNETLGSDWSIEMFQDDPPLLNSENDINSFPLMPKTINAHSNAENQLHQSRLGDPGTSRISSTLSESSNASSDEIIIRRDRSSAMIIDESDNEEMYYIFNNRDVSYRTLVNPSPTSSIIFTEDDVPEDIPPRLNDLGMIHWNRDKHLIPDWKTFHKQGLKNLVKMLNSNVGFQPPEGKKCVKLSIDGDYHWMNWKKEAGIRFQYGRWKYNAQCNGDCLKNHVSLPEKARVSSGLECHNPRCSGVRPTYLWEMNQKLYCAVECCDGYQEWHIAASIEVNGWGLSSFLQRTMLTL
jgi:hypothetical protein